MVDVGGTDAETAAMSEGPFANGSAESSCLPLRFDSFDFSMEEPAENGYSKAHDISDATRGIDATSSPSSPNILSPGPANRGTSRAISFADSLLGSENGDSADSEGYSHPLDMTFGKVGSSKPMSRVPSNVPSEQEDNSALTSSSRINSLQEATSFSVDPVFYPWNVGPARPEEGSPFSEEGAPKPTNEAFRLQVLQRYHLLDTGPEQKFDRLTALASQMFKTPVSLVSLVDEGRQFFKSNYGLEGVCQTDRNSSFCAFTLLPSKNPCLIVENAMTDSRFSRNPLVTGPPNIRFYAGAPLLTSGGFILGSLCIIDYVPRKFGHREEELLLSLSQLVVMEFEKHGQLLELQRQQAVKFEADKKGLLNAIDAFSEGLVLVDMSMKGQPIVFVNEGWEKITGYTSKEVEGLHCGAFLQGPLTDVSAVATLKSACMEGRAASVEIINYKKDGTPFWNWLRIRPVMAPSAVSPDGRVVSTESKRYFFGILSDCSSRKEKEMQLERIRMEEVEKEAATRAKRQFVANISHEIRTPMNAILACSQLLQDTSKLGADERELVQMITGSGQQLLSLINDILDFSKLEAGKMDLQVKEFSIWGCLDFCMEMLVLKSQTKGLDLSYNVDPGVPEWIWADEVRLRQILTNLLSNAAKFTEEGGEVEVSVTARTRPRRPAASFSGDGTAGHVSRHNSGSMDAGALAAEIALPLYEIEMSVRDTGIGMPKEFCNVIFEAFTQCDNSRTRKYEGTGLGMAIAKDLSERMGGRIWVESEVGKGSKFFFTFLASGSMRPTQGKSALLESAHIHVPTPLHGKRALLIGPTPSFRRMVGSMLQSWGMPCTFASTVEELQTALGPSLASLILSAEERKAGGQNGHLEPIKRDALPFDVVLVDSPTAPPHDDEKVAAEGANEAEPQMSSTMMKYSQALTVMQAGCRCSAVLPTFLLIGRHGKGQQGANNVPEGGGNVTVLSRPVRVKQMLQALMTTLAKEELASKAAKEASLAEDQGLQQLKILIAEDNYVNQKVLLKLLKGLGHEQCLTAFNGIKVLEQMRAHRFHLILMDVQMPEMDGLTATARVRRDFPEDQQPIIAALTADVGAGIEKECESAGMNSYLSKPVRKNELDSLLKQVSALFKTEAEGRATASQKKWVR
eukprot:TRINITY_DN645_c0_g1_i1.p1 TRINITY_DN645_c0_g1~~TRINITY_DN645_c0_g1_i1.p1  ORF type:complete len:1139 (-),score=211.04 TRINITY_DN645_c0_g1_i1:1780-5196(-)